MLLYHATTIDALESIYTDGLLVSHADAHARIKAVWLHTHSRSAWAVLHTQRRHKVTLEETVVIELTVPRNWLTRKQGGLWYSTRDIPPTRFVRAIAGTAYAQSAK
jgi:hypothetical protein